MKATIEHSAITHRYYVTLDGRLLGGRGVSRKDEAERIAKKSGATSIEHRERSATKALRNMGFSPEHARELAKEFRGRR